MVLASPKRSGFTRTTFELGGGVDVDHLVLLLGTLHRLFLCIVHANAETAVVVHHLGAVVDVLIVVIVLTAEKALLRLSTKDIVSAPFIRAAAAAWRLLQRDANSFYYYRIFAADVNNYKSFPSYKFCPETIISS